jgi:hypothetical protein
MFGLKVKSKSLLSINEVLRINLATIWVFFVRF